MKKGCCSYKGSPLRFRTWVGLSRSAVWQSGDSPADPRFVSRWPKLFGRARHDGNCFLRWRQGTDRQLG